MWSARQDHHRHEFDSDRLEASGRTVPAALTLRVATPEDLPRIARLAALDSSRPPEPPVLSAELDGEICVAVSLTDLHTVADPFRFTTEVRVIALARARQLLGSCDGPARPPARRFISLGREPWSRPSPLRPVRR